MSFIWRLYYSYNIDSVYTVGIVSYELTKKSFKTPPTENMSLLVRSASPTLLKLIFRFSMIRALPLTR